VFPIVLDVLILKLPIRVLHVQADATWRDFATGQEHMEQSSRGTAEWLRAQWTNPTDIFTILLIIGGEVVQVAMGQLCAGPVPFLTPVAFSFGWVHITYSHTLASTADSLRYHIPYLHCGRL
jgi:hypothetical protein